MKRKETFPRRRNCSRRARGRKLRRVNLEVVTTFEGKGGGGGEDKDKDKDKDKEKEGGGEGPPTSIAIVREVSVGEGFRRKKNDNNVILG